VKSVSNYTAPIEGTSRDCKSRLYGSLAHGYTNLLNVWEQHSMQRENNALRIYCENK